MASNIGHPSLYRRLACEVESSSTSQAFLSRNGPQFPSRIQSGEYGTSEEQGRDLREEKAEYKKMIGTDLIGFRGDSKHMFEILKA